MERRPRRQVGPATIILVLALLLLAVKNCSSRPQSSTEVEKRVMMCSDRLLNGIQGICRNPDLFPFATKRKRSHPFLDQEPLNEEKYEEEFEDDSEEFLQDEASSPFTLERRRKNIVDACCRNACGKREFMQFCAMSRNGEREQVLVTSTTTTTPSPPPPQVKQQLLPRHRLSIGVSKGMSSNLEAETRTDLFREAIQCLYDPKCGGLQIEGWEGNQMATRDNTMNKSTNLGKSKISTFSKFCSRGRRKQISKKQSQLLPTLLQWLIWAIPTKPPQRNAQFSPRVAEPSFDGAEQVLSPGEREPSNTIQRLPETSRFLNAGTQDGGKFGVSYRHRVGQGQGRPIGDKNPPNESEQNIRHTVADPPIRPSLGFPLGTYEGVRFNN